MLKSFMHRTDKSIMGFLNKRPGKDAGYDLYAAETKWFWPLQTLKVPSNGSIHIPKGLLGRITSRSGFSSYGWIVHPGTVDHGYSGIMSIVLTNLSFIPRRVKKGTRIAQLIFMPFEAVQIEEIDDRADYVEAVKVDSESDRGEKGFASSGMN